MEIKQYISENNVEQCKSPADVNTLELAEKKVGIKFGEQLKEYLLKYGYLAFKYIELYGINSSQALESDMVKQTLYLHKYFPATLPFVALENQGEGDYYLINSKDEIYEYVSEHNKLIPKGISLFDYIIQRFETVKNKY